MEIAIKQGKKNMHALLFRQIWHMCGGWLKKVIKNFLR